jgi:modulator of FtsH protease
MAHHPNPYRALRSAPPPPSAAALRQAMRAAARLGPDSERADRGASAAGAASISATRAGAPLSASAAFASLDAWAGEGVELSARAFAAPATGFDYGLSRRAFVGQTLGLLAAGLSITAAIAVWAARLDLAASDAVLAMVTALLVLAGLLAASAPGKRLSYALSLPLASLFAVLQGVAVGPVVNGYWMQAGGAAVVGGALAITLTALASAGGYAFLTRRARRDFSALGAWLASGTIVVLALAIASFYVALPALDLALAGVGAMLSIGYLLYDLKRLWTEGHDDPVMAALNLYVVVLNLFLSLLRLLEFLVSGD